MADSAAVNCVLGDGFLLIAAGLRRDKAGNLTADLILQNGHPIFARRLDLGSDVGRREWAELATGPDRPTADRLCDALLAHVLPDALAALQEDPKKPNQADLLLGMMTDLIGDLASDVAGEVDLFHDPSGVAYATVPVNGHQETWPLRSRGFREWLARKFHEQHGKTPNAQALVDATAVLSGKANFDGPERPVHVRIAGHEGAVYVDLVNPAWEAVEITAAGWRLVADPPVRFRRTRGMLPLPVPLAGGAIEDLKPFVNLPRAEDGEIAEDAWALFVAWLVGAYRPTGPYPVLGVHGEQGSAKSTLSRVARSLVDPNKAPIRTLPREERDWMIAASNGWIMVYDNLSHLADWQSDTACRIATGGGLAVRELYSDQDETILDAQRPQIMNGIEEIATRGDLLDRAIVFYLPRIPEQDRRSEKALWRDFDGMRPFILGSLFDAVATALANEPTTVLDGHPRMADFAVWATAAEGAFGWRPGRFLRAYRANRADANDLALDASPVVPALKALRDTKGGTWEGSAAELLRDLEGVVNDATKKQKAWPGDGRVLANALRRLASNLREAGIDVRFTRTGRKRRIVIAPTGEPASSTS